MEQDGGIDLSRRKLTSRLLVKRCIARGWKIAGFKSHPAIFLVYPPGVDKPIKIASASPPQMSRAAGLIADDKFISNIVLSLEELPVPAEVLIDLTATNYMEPATDFLTLHKKIVVKPLDASHGYGVSVDITTVEKLENAIDVARREARQLKMALLQEQHHGVDVRVVCIGYKYSNAMSRIPASVTGDGVHSISELIEIVNGSDDRGANYSSVINLISEQKAVAYLGEDAFNTIPATDEHVQVIGISNLGAGGILLNVDPDVPQFLRDMAVRAAKALDLPVAGIDFILKRLPKPSDTFEDLQPVIIEANASPTLAMYADLESKEQLALLDEYLDYITRSV